MNLEERIERLESIESIRYLQSKYQRCLDTRDFKGLSECFTIDASSDYGNGKMSYEGRDEILHFLSSVMTLSMPSTHLIHGGEIDIISKDTAKAKWYLEDQLYHDKYLMEIKGAAIYSVEYEKTDDYIDGTNGWKIKRIGYERVYEFIKPRGLFNLFTLRKRTFMNKIKKQDPSTLNEYERYFYEENVLKRKKK